MKKIFVLFLTIAISVANVHAQKYEGLALTPPMGWSTWNTFHDCFYEKDIKEIADYFVSLGLKDAGYKYINLDDYWQRERNKYGFIVPSPGKFPNGLKVVSDYVHSKGLKFGLYSDAGTMTCGRCPGSLGHEYLDAMMYAKWGVDYIKLDWCYHDNVDPKVEYGLMSKAIRASGRPMLLNICEWGEGQPWLWGKDIGHTWRTTHDLHVGFDDGEGSVLDILDQQVNLRQYAGPDHWNDPDMLQVGNGMSVSEDRAHFTMWCMLAAPLILGNDIRNMSKETYSIITNHDLIAIDQDSLGVQGLRYKQDDNIDYWFKPLKGGDWAFTILNRTTEPKEIVINWKDYVFFDGLSNMGTEFDKKAYKYVNLWDKSKTGTTQGPMKVVVNGHDVVTLRLTPEK